jgi:hypothetical protein
MEPKQEDKDDDDEDSADEDYADYEEVIMKWFLSQEPRNIRELAIEFFDYDLEEAWKFIENYDRRSVDEYDAEDYDDVAEETGYVDVDDEDYQKEKAIRLNKKNQNKVILVNTIYKTPAQANAEPQTSKEIPADKDGLGLRYSGLDVKSRQELYEFLGKKRRKTSKKGKIKKIRKIRKTSKKGKIKKTSKKGKSKSKKSPKNTRKYVKKR